MIRLLVTSAFVVMATLVSPWNSFSAGDALLRTLPERPPHTDLLTEREQVERELRCWRYTDKALSPRQVMALR